jgi:hypothetical protein
MFSDTEEDKRATLKAMYDYAIYKCAYGGNADSELGKFIRNDRRFDALDTKETIKLLNWQNGLLPSIFSWHTQETHEARGQL